MLQPLGKSSCCSTTSSAISILNFLLDFSYSISFVMLSHYYFNFQLTNNKWHWVSFHMFYWPSVYFPWWSVSLAVLLFFLIGLFLFYFWILRVICMFQYKSFIRCVFYRYFLPVCGLSFQSVFKKFY